MAGRGEPASVSLVMPIYSNRWVHCSSYTDRKLFHIGNMYEGYLITNLSSENNLANVSTECLSSLEGKVKKSKRSDVYPQYKYSSNWGR